MRILYHHRIRADDGQAVHVREMIRALRANGHTVNECALVPKAEESARLAEQDPAKESAGSGGFWRRLSLPRVAVEALEIGYGLRIGASRLLRCAGEADQRFDVVYERHALHCAAGLVAARRLGVPLVLEVNSPMCDEMAELGLLRFGGIARRTERRVLAGADAVLAVSEVLAARLIECGARSERVHVVRNGADPTRYPDPDGPERDRARARARERVGVPASGFVLGFVGYARPWHRLDLAVEILARQGFEAAELVVVGDGPALPALQEQATALGVEHRVRAIGSVPSRELPGLVLGFDASLIPAINPYASPLKAFDALAAGVPVIAPRQPNLEELFDHGVDGLLFEQGSVESLAAALEPLVVNPGRATAIGRAGRARLERERWTWAGQAERVAEIATNVVG
jgi:glycosyltransferase involved in cell wall biosynthesis